MSRSASRLARVLCSIWFKTVDAIIVRMTQPSTVATQQRKNTQCAKRSRMSGMRHSRPNWAVGLMPGLPPIATRQQTSPEVHFVPILLQKSKIEQP
jgi:hypothetical protein